MKKLFLFIFVFAIAFQSIAQVNFEALTLDNNYPQALQKLSFKYDSKLSPLISEKKIDIVVYQFTNVGMVVKEPVITKTGNIYSASINIDSNATCLAFEFSGEKEKDNNASKGYFVPIYNSNKEPVKGYYESAGQLYTDYGEYLFAMPNEPQKKLNLLEEGLQKYPEQKNEAAFYNSYLSALSAAKKAAAKPIIEKIITELEQRQSLDEGLYGVITNHYARNKSKAKADSLKEIVKQKFPDGSWVTGDMINKFLLEKSAEKRVVIYENFLKSSKDLKKDENMIKFMKSQITGAYENEKDIAQYVKWVSDMPMAQKASSLNNKSWTMAEEGIDIPLAKKLSAEATMYAKKQSENPTEKKPDNVTTKQWKEQLNGNYAMYADTYAYILYQLGEYKEGLPYAKIGATHNKFKDAEYNERYAMLLVKAAPASEAKNIIESMAKAGKASPKSKEALKEVYVKLNKSDAGFDKYLAKLEASAKAEKYAALVKTMINKPAPKFVLKDWEGKEVSLESLKGKIVVVDFWATWCGPCIASMPGMKKAEEQLAANPDVKFLFIDTWENVDNKLENSKEFMKKKNYSFYVLMDNENKMVSDFEVSGIPTKFIIDKQGNIRFKAVGFEGNTDALAQEVKDMVELAGK